MIQPNYRINLKVDNLRGFNKIWRDLEEQLILVGVPEAKGMRRTGKANNAMLAYIHDNGSPLRHIPPRPFLGAGLLEGRDQIVNALRKVGEAALNGRAVDLHPVGLIAVNMVRAKITRGPFTPLSPRTIAARRRRGRKGRMRPLIDTGQMRNAITYVIVKR